MDTNPLYKLFIRELEDVYDAERQIVDALPLMIQETTDENLRTSLQDHLEETEDQIERLDEIADNLGSTLQPRSCTGMAGIIEEGEKMLAQGGSPEIKDVMIAISAAKVEHYEMSTYTSLVTLANTMGYDEVEELLQENLDEEQAAADTLETAAKGGLFNAGLIDTADASESGT